MPVPVCMTASMTCTMGAAPSTLSVTSQQTVMIENQLAATIMDYAPFSNIPPFGICVILTSAASGVPTPCVPATVSPWTAGAVTVTNNNFVLLNNASTCTCVIGGTISITNPVPLKTTTA